MEVDDLGGDRVDWRQFLSPLLHETRAVAPLSPLLYLANSRVLFRSLLSSSSMRLVYVTCYHPFVDPCISCVVDCRFVSSLSRAQRIEDKSWRENAFWKFSYYAQLAHTVPW